jgi:hypothetical protein
MALNRANFITRTPNDNLLFQFLNDDADFIGLDVLPVKPISKQQEFKYQKDNAHLKPVDDIRDTKSAVKKVDYDVFTSNLTTVPYALGADVDPRDEAIFDTSVAQVRVDQMGNIASRLRIQDELRVASLCTTSGNYPSDLTSALTTGTNRWTDAGGDFEVDNNTARAAIKNRCGRLPNAVTMSLTTFDRLRVSPLFRDRVKFNGDFLGKEAIIAAFKTAFQVDYFFIGAAKYDSANDGATTNVGDIWGSGYVIFHYHNPSPGMRDVSYGHHWMRKELYTYEAIDPKRGGPDGRIVELEGGWEYDYGPGFVPDSSNTTKFGAGYLFRNVA